tara:strand:- start:1111 stop:1449 length:339 start_codon:yes stop_codon:yes gene_type:complete
MIPRGPVRVQSLFRPSTGKTQARFELVFNRNHPEKTTLVTDARRRYAAKSRSTKSITLSQGVETIGVEPLPLRLVNWQCDIRALVSQVMRTTRKVSVGTKIGSLYERHGKYG